MVKSKWLKKGVLIMTISLFVFLLVTLVVPFLRFKFLSYKNYLPSDKPLIVAHRGASASAPENTLLAFEEAITVKADILELDVHLSKDDSLIVIHDDNTKRTTGFDGFVGELLYAEIRKLNAGYVTNKGFTNVVVPTLDEVLKTAKGRSKVLIEIKWPKHGLYQDIVRKIVKCIEANNAQEWVIVQSFEVEYLNQLLTLTDKIECHQLIFGFSRFLPIYFDRRFHFGNFVPLPKVKSVNIFYAYVSKSFVESMHKNGIKVFAFTVDSDKDAKRLMQMGVDGIITNKPELLKKIVY